MTHSFSGQHCADEAPENQDDIALDSHGIEHTIEEKDGYPTTLRLIPILIGICFQSLCIALDNTILATAVPKITEDFNSLKDLSWYASAYLLTTCAVTLPFGKIYTYYSTKWTYLTALAFFEIGSLICAVTPTSRGLIFGRAIAGVGSGGLSPGALIILTDSLPIHRRALYTGIVGSISGIATVAGPLLGGVFTDRLSWRWCFYVNLPLGAITGLFILSFFNDTTKIKLEPGVFNCFQKMDPIGILIFLPAVISLILALQWGGARYDWGDARIIVLCIVFGILGLLWCCVQVWKQDDATVPPRLVRNRSVCGAIIHAIFLGGSFFVFGYYLPIWFQAIKEVSAAQSGINNLPTVVAMIICSTLAGLLINMIGYYAPFMYIGSAFLTIGFGLCTTFKVNTGHREWVAYQVMIGVGAGLGFQQCINALQTVLQPRDIPIGIAIVTFAQSLSGTIFISVAQNVFQNRLVASISEYVPSISADAIIEAGAANLSASLPQRLLPAVFYAYNVAVTQAFYVCVAGAATSFIGAGLVEWKSMRRPGKGK